MKLERVDRGLRDDREPNVRQWFMQSTKWCLGKVTLVVAREEQVMEKSAGYYVQSSSWPSNVEGDGLTLGQLYGVLDTFDDNFSAAMTSLSEAEPVGGNAHEAVEEARASVQGMLNREAL